MPKKLCKQIQTHLRLFLAWRILSRNNQTHTHHMIHHKKKESIISCLPFTQIVKTSVAAVWFWTLVWTWTFLNRTGVWSGVWGWGWTRLSVQFRVRSGPKPGRTVQNQVRTLNQKVQASTSLCTRLQDITQSEVPATAQDGPAEVMVQKWQWWTSSTLQHPPSLYKK